MKPRFNYFKSPDKDGLQHGHIMFYCEWGNPKNKDVVLCVHGLSRNSRDFDYLANSLQDKYRVISVDIVGRGKSEWVQDKSLYDYNTYVDDIIKLLNSLKIDSVHWVGTSMGGIIGMLLASKHPHMIKSLLLNDIGPVIPGKAIERILKYLGSSYEFYSKTDAEKAMRERMATFGVKKEEHWKHLVKHGIVKKLNDKYTFAYDPEIIPPASLGSKIKKLVLNLLPKHRKPAFPDVSLLDIWQKISCPVIAMRGKESDVLTEDVVEQMKFNKDDMKFIEFQGVGHAPMLMEDEQINAVKDWLSSVNNK